MISAENDKRIFAIPNTFDLVSEPIHASTAIAMSKVLGVIVLKGLFCHWGAPVLFSVYVGGLVEQACFSQPSVIHGGGELTGLCTRGKDQRTATKILR